MSEKPILFNTEMVRAILDGRKTCTRRLVNPRQFMGMLPDRCKNATPGEFLKNKRMMFKPYCDMTDAELIMTAYKEPYQPGDILYVRETWSEWTGGYIYRAWNSPFPQAGAYSEEKWHPSIHMPKDAARIWLKVTDVRVERLQEITEGDCIKEGIYLSRCKDCNAPFGCDCCPDEGYNEIDAFAELWDSTIKKTEHEKYGFDANPWVWVVTFETCEKPRSIEK